jgi:hypothetical protein
MPFSEDAKAQIKEEVALYTHKYHETLDELVSTYRDALDDIEKTKTAYRNTIVELNAWKWVVRFLFLLLLGGTVWGVAKYQDIIDNRIAQHVFKMDRLPTAISLAESSNWRGALIILNEVKEDFTKTEFKPSKEFKDGFYPNYVWILSQPDLGRETDGSFVGQPQWDELSHDRDYSDLVTAGTFRYDDGFNTSLAFCMLKFVGKDRNNLSIARSYFQAALDSAEPGRKSPRLFNLAMLDLIEEKNDLAREKLKQAEELNPGQFKNSDLWIYRNTMMNSNEFVIYDTVYHQRQNGDFRKVYEDFLRQFAPNDPSSKANPKPQNKQ